MDGVWGKIGFWLGWYCWEVWWEGLLGIIVMIGFVIKYVFFYCYGYVGLFGGND